MEAFLIIVLIALWLYQYQSMSKKMDDLISRFWDLERLLNNLKAEKEPDSRPVEEEAISNIVQVKEEEKAIDPPTLPAVELTEEIPVVESTFKTLGYIEVETLQETEEEYKTLFPENEPEPDFNTPESVEDTSTDNGWWSNFRAENQNLEKFIGENLLSKIGIAILVLGIGFFVKYAIDKEWIGEVARVGIGILAGGIVLGFAHKLRNEFQAFSSVLVAGGISIFYFTLAIAFHEYALYSQTVAFALMTLVTLFSVLISMNYNRQELAILALLGGFATPLMVSTGSGNYKVLFTYLLILDGGMLVLSAYREWKWVNILTFVFSLLFYTTWCASVLHSTNDHLGTFWFGAGFYLVFTVANLIYPIRRQVSFNAYAYSIMLMNTAIFYGLGMALLEQSVPSAKGVFTLVMSLSQLGLTFMVKKNGQGNSPLFYIMLGLTLTFATLIAPVQLEGNHITLFWAAESALLVWLSSRSKMEMYRLGSMITAFLAGISLVMDWMKFYGNDYPLMIVANKVFLTGIFVSASLAVAARFQRRDGDDALVKIGEVDIDTENLSWIYKLCATLIAYLSCMLELNYQLRFSGMLLAGVYQWLLAFHLIFSGVLVIYINRAYREKLGTLNVILTGINVLIYALVCSNQSDKYITLSVMGNSLNNSPFIAHFISLIFVSIQFYLSYSTAKKLSPKITAWFLVSTITLILSQEVMMDVQFYNASQLMHLNLDQNTILLSLIDIGTTVIKSVYPVLWGAIAFVLLSMGIKRSFKELRLVSLILIGVTILKLFLYDIRNASEGGKIAAFILLGVVLLIISFTYQKIKAILLDEDDNKNEEA